MSQYPDYSHLPHIMVAPNGARRGKTDHPQLPITIEETVTAAKACLDAGADGLHAHVRDDKGAHVLDAGLYQELQSELAAAVPDMFVQITTEAVGIYSPTQQRAIVEICKPKAVSISLKEMLSEGQTQTISHFYKDCSEKKIAVQHILYSPQELEMLAELIEKDFLPAHNLQLLFVLGRYSKGQVSSPSDLHPFLSKLERVADKLPAKPDWACCAFGQQETDCLLEAFKLGGKARIGFENNLHHPDGSLAQDNADRVSCLIKAHKELA